MNKILIFLFVSLDLVISAAVHANKVRISAMRAYELPSLKSALQEI
jgi:hypothetical protein